MIALKTILFPTDFSDFSLYALDYAASFARQYGAKLVLMHVVDVFLTDPAYFAPYVPDRRMFVDFEKKSRERLEEIAKTKVPAGIPVEIVVKQGRAFVEIVREAREREVDLVVIATHGRTGLSHAMFGSTAEKVVRKAPCPVLSIRHPEHEFVMP
jgi:nucleotide-binding universal stress UspA family protein